MLFSELNFWIFFGVVLLAYNVLAHRAQNRMLLVASYVFYASWDWRFLSLIILSTVVDFAIGRKMDVAVKQAARKRLLLISIATNLGMLAIFKYLGFFVENFSTLLGRIGYDADPFVLSIILPVGISFYTFQTMSYTIDIYRRELKPTKHFLDFALFVAFFPQLVAGPIERARNLLPNIEKPRAMVWLTCSMARFIY